MSTVVPTQLVVSVSGDCCIAAVPELTARLDAAVAAGHHHLVVDLAECTLLSAAALRVLATTEKRLAAAGGALRVTNPRPLAARVLAITGLDHLLDEPTSGA